MNWTVKKMNTTTMTMYMTTKTYTMTRRKMNKMGNVIVCANMSVISLCSYFFHDRFPRLMMTTSFGVVGELVIDYPIHGYQDCHHYANNSHHLHRHPLPHVSYHLPYYEFAFDPCCHFYRGHFGLMPCDGRSLQDGHMTHHNADGRHRIDSHALGDCRH
jgi:hypothetical protein